jgi:hypothetical protein
MNEQQIQQLATAVALAVASVVMVEPVSVVEPVCKPKARKVGKPKAGQVAKKVSKAKGRSKSENQTLTRQINGQLANATKASDMGDDVGALVALQQAMKVTPSGWVSTVRQIERKYVALGLAA